VFLSSLSTASFASDRYQWLGLGLWRQRICLRLLRREQLDPFHPPVDSGTLFWCCAPADPDQLAPQKVTYIDLHCVGVNYFVRNNKNKIDIRAFICVKRNK
jgi:hypothetical protein